MESTSVLRLNGGLKLRVTSLPVRKPRVHGVELDGRRKRAIISMFVEEKVKINETSLSTSSSSLKAVAAAALAQTEKAIWHEDDHFTWGLERPPSASLASPSTAEANKAPAHNDNWFDRLAIHYLRMAIEATAGMSSSKEGYDGLVDAAIMISKKFDSMAQQHLVIQSLQKAFPVAILTVIKNLLPQSTFSREYFAAFTTIFFPWLIGPCEIRKSEVNAKSEKNVVYIPKCRFLERTNCVGMCTNLCKIPCQKFIQNSLGMPVYMVPNFEHMSCEMIFGQQPPADDPALKQPCFHKSCIAKQTHAVKCS